MGVASAPSAAPLLPFCTGGGEPPCTPSQLLYTRTRRLITCACPRLSLCPLRPVILQEMNSRPLHLQPCRNLVLIFCNSSRTTVHKIACPPGTAQHAPPCTSPRQSPDFSRSVSPLGLSCPALLCLCTRRAPPRPAHDYEFRFLAMPIQRLDSGPFGPSVQGRHRPPGPLPPAKRRHVIPVSEPSPPAWAPGMSVGGVRGRSAGGWPRLQGLASRGLAQAAGRPAGG